MNFTLIRRPNDQLTLIDVIHGQPSGVSTSTALLDFRLREEGAGEVEASHRRGRWSGELDEDVTVEKDNGVDFNKGESRTRSKVCFNSPWPSVRVVHSFKGFTPSNLSVVKSPKQRALRPAPTIPSASLFTSDLLYVHTQILLSDIALTSTQVILSLQLRGPSLLPSGLGVGGRGKEKAAFQAPPPPHLMDQLPPAQTQPFSPRPLQHHKNILPDPPRAIHMFLPYGTLTNDKMCSIPLPTLQPPRGLLFLWVTGRAMERVFMSMGVHDGRQVGVGEDEGRGVSGIG
ncbi:hypothetical protein EV360DRAFT_85272 [Lentinula raphanica]|nr:hypothetical protein EV360DRAFT_85272 [Lentinula raphanica]